ncbi:MAG: type II toxin-antitoxin system RelE family toxin, partial [Candidatus Anammoxibacter sp.]
MLKINISRDARKFLKKLTPKHGRQVSQKITALRENPKPNDSKWLKGYPYMRIDIGEYRVVYNLDDDLLNVFVVGKRND